MPFAGVTIQEICLRLLKYIGVRQLAPEPVNSQLESIQPGDLDDLLACINGAMQEVFEAAPDEMRQQGAGAVINAPASGTCSVIQFGFTISAFVGYLPYMNFCTCRLAGDTQDNRLINATTLERPFMGATGANVGITVYHDFLTLPTNVDQVKDPVELPNQWGLIKANDYINYLRFCGVPLVVDDAGHAINYPFFYFYQKTVARPMAYFPDTYFEPLQNQQVKGIRLGPLPDQTYPLAFRVALNPPVFHETDIAVDCGAGNYTDPGTLIPVSNSWVASIFLPYALQRWTAHPAFKNEAAKAEIMRQFKQAEGIVTGTTASKNPNPRIRYV